MKAIPYFRYSLRAYFHLLVLLFGLFTCPDAWAQGKSMELTLQKAFQIALSQNPSIQGAAASHSVAEAGISLARSSFFPKLDLYETLSRTNNPPMVFTYKLAQEMFTGEDFAIDRLNDPEPRNNLQTRLVLTQPLFNQGREYIGYRLSRLAENMAFLNRRLVSQAVIFAVERAYYRVLLARESVDVLKNALKTARAHENLAIKRHKAGLALKSDVLAAEVQRINIERQLLRAEGDLDIAMAGLNQAMGEDQGVQWDLQPVSKTTLHAGQDIDYWIRTAHAHRPEIRQAEKALEMARLKVKEARWRFLPSVNLQGVYESNAEDIGAADGDSWSLMAVASINLFSGQGDRARLKAAAAEEKKAEARAREIKNLVDLQIREAYVDLITARKQLDVTARAVTKARETLRILKSRYENGLALMVELLSADTYLKEAEIKETQAKFDVKTALARLKHKAGILLTHENL